MQESTRFDRVSEPPLSSRAAKNIQTESNFILAQSLHFRRKL